MDFLLRVRHYSQPGPCLLVSPEMIKASRAVAPESNAQLESAPCGDVQIQENDSNARGYESHIQLLGGPFPEQENGNKGC